MRRLLPLLLLSAILLGACAPTVTLFTREPDPASATNPPSTPVPALATSAPTPTRAADLGISPEALKGVEVVAWHGWDGASASLFAQMAAEFTLTNKWGIKVTVVSQRNLNLLASEVDKSLRTPEHPDLLVALPEQLFTWQDNLADLTPYVSQPDFGLNLADFPAAFVEQSLVNGVRYGLPATRSARFLFYNTTFAHDLGFDAPPQTADDFRKQACAANNFWKQDKDLTNDGYGGLALDVASNWQTPYSWLAASGGQVFTDGEFRFNTPENISALKFISDLRSDGCAWQSSSASNYEHLTSRRALFVTGNLSDLPEQKNAFTVAASTDAWTVLPFPGVKPVIVAYGPDYALLKSSNARQLAAWLFLRWMLEPLNQSRWASETGLLPVTKAAAALLKSDRATNPQWSAAIDLIPQAVSYPQTAQWRLANKVLADGFMSYFGNFPNSTLAGVLTVMDATVKDLTK